MSKRSEDVYEEGPPPKRNRTSKCQWHLAPHRHHVPIENLIRHFSKLRIDTPPIEKVPQEIILEILENLVHPLADRRDILNLCRTSRQLQAAATTILYRAPYLNTAKSVGCFLFTLTQNPDLVPLVRGLICSGIAACNPRLAYAFWNEDDTTYNAMSTSFVKFGEGPLLGLDSSPIPDRISSQLLEAILRLLPQISDLSIPQTQLLEGPYTSQARLQHLTKLSISIVYHPEASFVSCPAPYSRRLLSWLDPHSIGARFPVLTRLSVLTPTGQWMADLVPGDSSSIINGSPERYVERLVTRRTKLCGPAEWEFMSLGQPIFDPSKFHTLLADNPGRDSKRSCHYATSQSWDLNRFLATTGRGLRTLSLNWQGPHRLFGYFGRNNTQLTNLNSLTNLACLTVSLQVLFGQTRNFNDCVDKLRKSPSSELDHLFPESLQILRVNEFIAGLFENSFRPRFMDEPSRIGDHNAAVDGFLQVLRDHWLAARGDRELWFRRWPVLDRPMYKNRHHGRDGLSDFVGHPDVTARWAQDEGFVSVARRSLAEKDEEEERTAVYQDYQLAVV
ncbi:hypothetical protein VM1G_05276 [Cytospora mali]|uniref:Uncharacterized protein n=1 Tax=Cytospora mali TaxID=578113 RepID=A0A194W0F9_CYTMA|nr:hypothetical protein VM1G_05276 [Valsa mali]